MNDVLGAAELRAMWHFDDPQESEAVLRAAADGAASLPGRQGELLTQVARALGLQKRFDEAHHVLDALEPITPAVAVRTMLERGRLQRDADEVPAALSSFEAAAVAAEWGGLETLEVDALHMLAIADPDRADVWASRAMAIVDGSADPETRRWAIALENNRGWDLMDLGRYAEALERFEASHRAALELGGPEQEQVARWAIARCLRALGRPVEALAMQRVLAEQRPDDPYVHEEIEALEDAVGFDG
ncbi:tetratricopeptide repeat protein [Actinotalea sp. M2MS4P-6]|uniref:tetratricopeptide repeat protein n=1 Tax=Actinotalea sp. M2MS4P-6 TaxID=2983762 RepID=UPI0021E35F33|nr:tetratricopeptide repeat protein [Actinotalea sp. M2MS4P-6]MCV2396009.1 tetratricopeptide repeat protein [Actinotalea sp. M2MS4P-6]